MSNLNAIIDNIKMACYAGKCTPVFIICQSDDDKDVYMHLSPDNMTDEQAHKVLSDALEALNEKQND